MNNQNFEELKQKIIPYFVEIYGKEYEDLIIDRINKIVPIFYTNMDDQISFINYLKDLKQFELTIKFLEYNNIIIPEVVQKEIEEREYNKQSCLKNIPGVKEILEVYFDSNSYKFIRFNNLDKLFVPPENKTSYENDKNIYKLKLLGFDVNKDNYSEWLMSDEAKAFQKEYETNSNYILQLDEEYRQFENQFKKLDEKRDYIKKSINEKYIMEFLQSIGKHMTDKDKKVLNEYVENPTKDKYWLLRELDILQIIGKDFNNYGLLQAFTNDSNEKLNSESTSSFTKESIINDRIKYYKLLGIYDEQIPIDEFMKTSIAIKNIPNQKFIDEIISKKEHYKTIIENEILKSISNYEECMEQLNKLNLLDLDPLNFCLDIINSRIKCISPSAVMVNGKPEIAPILFYSPEACLKNYADVMFIHEINHAIEFTLLNFSDDEQVVKTGFEVIGKEDLKRNYEKFSETVNQEIAALVTEAMHRDGIFLFDNPKTSKVRGATSYELNNMFVKDFFEQFKKEIMLARVGTDMTPLFDVIGKENFEELNELINKTSKLSKEYKKIPLEMYQKYDTILNRMIFNYNNIRTHETIEENVR